jgi:hypothetical protein
MPLSLRAPLPRPDLSQESRERTDEAALLANPHFSDMLSPKWGAARKIFRLVDPIPQAADTAPRRPKREEEHLSCSASARDKKRLFGR